MTTFSRFLAVLLAIASALIALVLASHSLPSLTWPTGRMQVSPITVQHGGPAVEMAPRLWIDTDAGCGLGAYTDVDDCFALALLIEQRFRDLEGISTVFGNADQRATHERVLELVRRMWPGGSEPVPVYAGSASAHATGAPAHDGLRDALAQGPLTIVSLGPLTNVAAALADRPDLRRNVSRVIAVMGRRPGHLFHPAEGNGRGMLLGHGPIFRDLNFVKDPEAASKVFAMRLPITLIPYDAGRDIVLTVADLDRIGKSSQNDAWMIAQSHDWLAFWKNTVGVSGFPPFDLLAAAYYLEPTRFKCARVQVDIRPDRYIWTSRIFGAKALLVEANDSRSSVIYCPEANANLKTKLVDLLAATRRRAVRDAFGTWAQIPRPMR